MPYVKHQDDLSGIESGYLRVVGRAVKGRDLWKCVCKCGKINVREGRRIRSRSAKSCGCMTKEILSVLNTVHGRSVESSEHFNTYSVWQGMRRRCGKKDHKSFNYYGGRGIKVCERWSDFTNFLKDMGDVPPGMTLGRIDNDGNYSPKNCRWESMKQQANNRRNNNVIEYSGIKLNLQQWSEKTGLARDVIEHRISAGWSIGDALTRPPKIQKNSRPRPSARSVRRAGGNPQSPLGC